MNTRKLIYHLGNLLIIVSLVGFTYTLYPVIAIYLFPPQPRCHAELDSASPTSKGEIPKQVRNDGDCEKTVAQQGFYISIPKIHAYSRVIENVDPWKESVYQEALKKGVAHAKGTALPGKKGTIFLFAHSSGAPWQVTHTNTIFLRLGELEKGDEIVITYNGKLHTFVVTDKKEVWPNETQYLENTNKNQLILQTCTPIGTSLKRLLVFAELKK